YPRTGRRRPARRRTRKPARIPSSLPRPRGTEGPEGVAERMSADTLARRATSVLEVKHSRFIANAAPVSSPAEALDYLSEVAVRDATHNCWAWRIGGDYRSSDDGEPAGTAGRPILAAIDGHGYDQVMVVVTRWYGGIKLGAGGLVRAYGG